MTDNQAKRLAKQQADIAKIKAIAKAQRMGALSAARSALARGEREEARRLFALAGVELQGDKA